MGKTTNVLIGTSVTSSTIKHSTSYSIETINGNIYYIYLDATRAAVYYIKSLNNGISWSKAVTIFSTNQADIVSVWYDRWSGIEAGLIHCAYIGGAGVDVLYRNIDTENSDALSAQTTIFDGASVAFGGTLSITRTRGGNIICGGSIDAGVEIFCYKSTDVGATWASIAAVFETNQDQLILLPGWAADNQDAICIYYDSSATEISRKLYDDSADSWAETSIATSISLPAATASYPNFSAAVDITNSQNILVCWTAVDTANADLRCWKITEGAITEVTNVVLNSTDDQGECAIGIDTINNYWYVFYGGKSNGSETWNTAVNIYYKVSQDGGTTWGPETALTSSAIYLRPIYCCPRFVRKYGLIYMNTESFDLGTATRIFYSIDNNIPRTTFQLGM